MALRCAAFDLSCVMKKKPLVPAGGVVADVLLKRTHFAAQVFDAPLQHVADGKHPQELAIVIHHGQVPEMPFDHGDQRFSRPSLRSRQLHRSGHQLANRRLRGFAAAQRKLAQHVAFGKDTGHAPLAVDDCNRADVEVKHLVDCICHGGFYRNRCRFGITKFKHIHTDLRCNIGLPQPTAGANENDCGIMTHAEPVSSRLITSVRLTVSDYFISLLKTLPSFITNWTFCRTLMSRSGSSLTATMSA